MKKKGKNIFLRVYILCLVLFGCVTPYELKQEDNFDNRLVIEGRLTNEFNFQEIKLSRTYSLDKWTVIPVEKNANIRVIEDGTTSYEYEEK